MFTLNKFIKLFVPKKKVGLALSGGVARGISHIGVLKVFAQHKIPLHCLSGCSAGAIIGALYAAGMDPLVMESNAKKLGWFRFLKLVPIRHGLLSTDEIKNFIIENIGDRKFSDLNLPFSVSASDLKSGKEVVIDEGSVAEAVAASCAFPTIFEPLEYQDKLLVDGGLTNNLPTSHLKKRGANFIVAVDCVPVNPIDVEFKNVFQIFSRTLDIAMRGLSKEGRRGANVLVEPEIPADIYQLDIDKSARLIKAGEIAAQGKIFEIKTKLFL